MTMIGRRRVLQGMGAAATLALPGHGALAQAGGRITVAAYGGVFETAMRKTFSADFTKRTGATADIQLGNPNQWISQVQASPAKPPIDVVLSGVDAVLQIARQGVFEKVSVEKMPNLADVPEFFSKVCEGWGVCFDYGSAGLAYHKGRIKNPPQSLKEFVDRTARGEWTASLSTAAYEPGMMNVIWSLNDIYGGKLQDISPALDAVKRMRKNTIFWSSVTDFLTQLESGEADIGIYLDGRVWAHYDTGATWIGFVNPSEGAVISPIAALKPKNASPLAWEYINSMIAPGPQAEFSEIMNYGMTNSKTHYSDKVLSRITPWDKTRFPPVEEIGKYHSEWVERWNKEIGV